MLSELQPGDRRVALLAEAGMPFACFGRTGRACRSTGPTSIMPGRGPKPCGTSSTGALPGRGYIGYASGTYWDAEREAGYRAGLASRGIPGDGAGLLRVDDDASARARIRSFISSARPDAVAHRQRPDREHRLQRRGGAECPIGHDLAVVGFDGSIGAELLHPALTSVVIPVDDIARRVVGRAWGRSRTARTASQDRSSRPGAPGIRASHRPVRRGSRVPGVTSVTR